MTYQCINQQQAMALIDEQQAQVVDIRDPASYQAGHIKQAVHLDNASLANFLATADKEKPVIVCCYHGNSSKSAADFLNGQGFSECYSLDGGFTLWQQNGLAAQ